LDESLRKYIVPQEHPWDDDDTYTYVYYLDPLRFEEFKAELDAGGECLESDGWTRTQDFGRGRTFVRFAARLRIFCLK
jgi:hypothetical protein